MKFLPMTWSALASAPHRLFFVGGACQGVAAVLWWLLELSGRFGGFNPSLPRTIPPVWAHAYLMIYGFFPFFIFGFLFTFFPNWLDAGSIPSRYYLSSFFLIASGTVLFYVGLILDKNILLLAVLSEVAGWGIGAISLIRILLPARSPEKIHLGLMTFFVILGEAGLLSFFLWLFTDRPLWLNAALVIGIWFFLLPLVVTVSHLVIPFFSKAALQNYRVVQAMSILWVLLAGIFLRGLLEGIQMRSSFWIPDALLLLFASYLSVVWGFWKSIGIKFLFMLHLSFAWFSIALVLDLLQSLAFLWGRETESVLGFAPLHALTIGFFSSMVVGMSTRVTLGHSGRRVGVDGAAWTIFLFFQGAALLRVLADFFPAGGLLNVAGYEGSALLWIGGFSFWLAKYGSLLWQPALLDA
jgi:uncharacterized protein involved in response to NO